MATYKLNDWPYLHAPGYDYSQPVHLRPVTNRMHVASFLIHRRHCTCIYYQDWHRTRRPKPAAEGGILPAVSQAVSARSTDPNAGQYPAFSSPRNTLASSGVLIAVNEPTQQQVSTPLLQAPPPPAGLTSTGLAFDEEAKLVYGVILSLRNMVKKLSGRSELDLFAESSDIGHKG